MLKLLRKTQSNIKRKIIEKRKSMNIYDILSNLNIHYEEVSHPAIYTIKDAINANILSKIEGTECKNLFVKSKNDYYLILIEATKRVDFKKLAQTINTSKLSFCSEEELKTILNLNIGSVTPLGIINDQNNLITLLIDQDLKEKKILVHPNINTKTISINYQDLIKFIEYTNHKCLFF